jgi:hypothetical protein
MQPDTPRTTTKPLPASSAESCFGDRRIPKSERRKRNNFYSIPPSGDRRNRRDRRSRRSDFINSKKPWYLMSNPIVDYIEDEQD